MSPTAILLTTLIALTAFYMGSWWTIARGRLLTGGHGADEPVKPTALHVAIGFVTNFFDTLGIGSFATTTSACRLWRLVPDQQIPGTLNVGHVLPTIVQAVLFISGVGVEFLTLILMIGGACAGAWLGAGTRNDDGRLIVTSVRRETPALAAGLNVDDEILAIEDVRVRADGLTARLDQYKPNDKVSVLVARRDRLTRLDVTLGAEPGRPFRLEVDPEASEAQQQRLISWIGQ